LTEAVELARAAGELRVAADAAVAVTQLRLFTGQTLTHDEARSELAESVRVFREFDNQAGLARAFGLAGQLRFWAGEATEAIDDLERAAQHAQNARDRPQEIQSLGYVLIASVHGPMPVHEALARAEETRGRVDGDRRLEVTLLRCVARLEAMQGRFDLARQRIREAATLADELGLGVSAASVQADAGDIELLAGDPVTAERIVRLALEDLQRIGDQGYLVTIAAILVDALFAQGRGEEAAALIDQVADLAIADDLDPQVGWRRVKAKLLAERGEFEEAERLGRESVALARRTDYLVQQGRALEDLAVVLRLAGRPQDASIELESAMRLYEQKGDLTSLARTTALLDELRA
jgi:tetratricopeptide (TPR) repeat protein